MKPHCWGAMIRAQSARPQRRHRAGPEAGWCRCSGAAEPGAWDAGQWATTSAAALHERPSGCWQIAHLVWGVPQRSGPLQRCRAPPTVKWADLLDTTNASAPPGKHASPARPPHEAHSPDGLTERDTLDMWDAVVPWRLIRQPSPEPGAGRLGHRG
jgi:hypothetical protein